MSALVRPARPTDAAALRELQTLLAEPTPTLLSAALTERSRSVPTHTARLLVSPAGDGRPVGYLLAVDAGATHIAELAVDSRYRREGRASALLRTVCADATEPVSVHVAADNEPARSLYRRVGFVEIDRSPNQFDGTAGLKLQYRSQNSN